jgi:hypothetical protein
MTDKPITPLPMPAADYITEDRRRFWNVTSMNEHARAAADCALNATAQGMMLVPREPTDAMIEAAKDERMECFKDSNLSVWTALTRIYKAALAAAPTAPIPAVDAVAGEPVARVYGSQYTQAQREWCQRYERETTFEPLMCDFEAGNISFLEAAKESRKWFEDWSNDAYLRGCDNIPGEMEALHEEITGEKP